MTAAMLFRVLLVESPTPARDQFQQLLCQSEYGVDVVVVATVAEAAARANSDVFDIALIEHSLAVSDDLAMFRSHQADIARGTCAVVVYGDEENEMEALQLVQAGAHDCLLRAQVTAARLHRVMIQAGRRADLLIQLHERSRQVRSLVERDALTGLANRARFMMALEEAMSRHTRDAQTIGLLVFDIDNFTLLNDSYGHHGGDQLLQAVVERVSRVLRRDELFARLGNDEFGVLLKPLAADFDVARVAERIRRAMQTEFELSGSRLRLSVSVGIALSEQQSCVLNADEFLKRADIALYRSKRRGKGEISFFEHRMQDQAQRKLALVNGLSRAIKKNEFKLHYQPVFAADNLDLVGFEALIRWHSESGLVPPDEFIPLAEQSNDIVDIGRWVIKEAVTQLGIWNKGRARPLNMAINISPRQLNDIELPSRVRALCERCGVDPAMIEFELTETALLGNQSDRLSTLTSLVAMRCGLALDDFGTGYSSVSHLQNTPLSTVKLDRSLMPQTAVITADGTRRGALLEALVKMLKTLNLTIVAEGVETAEQEALCRSLGVDRLQGFYYSRPVAADVITADLLNASASSGWGEIDRA